MISKLRSKIIMTKSLILLILFIMITSVLITNPAISDIPRPKPPTPTPEEYPSSGSITIITENPTPVPSINPNPTPNIIPASDSNSCKTGPSEAYQCVDNQVQQLYDQNCPTEHWVAKEDCNNCSDPPCQCAGGICVHMSEPNSAVNPKTTPIQIHVTNSDNRIVRIYIDGDLAGRTDADGNFVSEPLATGSHKIFFAYLPGTDVLVVRYSTLNQALIKELGDRFDPTYGLIPNQVRYLGGTEDIYVTENPPIFSVTLQQETYNIPKKDYGTEEWVNLITSPLPFLKELPGETFSPSDLFSPQKFNWVIDDKPVAM